MQKYAYLSIIIFLLSSCLEQEQAPYRPPESIKELIAGSTSKTWKLAKRYNGENRMNMGDCFLSYKQTFSIDGSVNDNNGAFTNCGPSLLGQWTIVKDSLGYSHIRISSKQIPELMGTKENFKDFRIFYASQDSLHISFVHKQYGTQRRISDYLVNENAAIADRDFHY